MNWFIKKKDWLLKPINSLPNKYDLYHKSKKKLSFIMTINSENTYIATDYIDLLNELNIYDVSVELQDNFKFKIKNEDKEIYEEYTEPNNQLIHSIWDNKYIIYWDQNKKEWSFKLK